jgi:hypothetical protein
MLTHDEPNLLYNNNIFLGKIFLASQYIMGFENMI